MSYEFAHWGERVRTDALPFFYIIEQFGARLSDAFLFLLAVGIGGGVVHVAILTRTVLAAASRDEGEGLRTLALAAARGRPILVVWASVFLPVGFLMVQRARLYDGIRHVLFVIPMLAIIAGAGLTTLLPWVRRQRAVFALAAGLWIGNVLVTLAKLHPLEYVAMNTLAGGTRSAYERFELDYLAVAATEAARQLQARLDYDPPIMSVTAKRPSVMVCIPWREWSVAPMLTRPWTIETDVDKADFVIETERWRCAAGRGLHLIDEVKRLNRSFAWIYARQSSPM